MTPEELIQNVLVGKGITVSNVVFTGAAQAVGEFDGSNSNIGIDNGIILSTGSVVEREEFGMQVGPIGPNNNEGSSTDWTGDGDDQLESLIGEPTHDAAILEFDFTPQGDKIEFTYVFASEEYPDYVFQFNDVFAFFISGPGISGDENIAIVPGTSNPVSIDNINSIVNPDLFVDNGDGTTGFQYYDETVTNFNGFTVPLIASSTVTPCQTYHMKIAISDVMDGIYDSGVFLKGGSLSSAPNIDIVQTTTKDLGIENLIAEGCSEGGLQFTRYENLDAAYTLNYRILGTAGNGIDVTSISGSVDFAVNQDVASLNVNPIADNIIESNETLTFRFANENVCEAGDSSDYSFTITDADELTSLPDSADFDCSSNEVTISMNYDGGFGPYTLAWSTGESTTTLNVNPTTTTLYEFEVTDLCGSSTVNDFKVNVSTSSTMDLIMPNDTSVKCAGQIVNLSPVLNGGTAPYTYAWSTGSSATQINQTINSTSTVELTITDKCGGEIEGEVTISLDYEELEMEVFSDATVCFGDTLNFSTVVTGGVKPYSILWSTGQTTDTIMRIALSDEILSVTAMDSCGVDEIEDEVELTVQVPDVDIEINAARMETEADIIFFPLVVGDIVAYDWDLGNGIESREEVPTTSYFDDTTYTVSLVVTDDMGCVDSTLKTFVIKPLVNLYVPNSFTPDDNGLNDVFRVSTLGVHEFQMWVYSRWGEVVYYSEDYTEGWDGRINEIEAPIGVYVYKVFAKDEAGKEFEKMGHVTIVR